jgi:hypothetical protein
VVYHFIDYDISYEFTDTICYVTDYTDQNLCFYVDNTDLEYCKYNDTLRPYDYAYFHCVIPFTYLLKIPLDNLGAISTHYLSVGTKIELKFTTTQKVLFIRSRDPLSCLGNFKNLDEYLHHLLLYDKKRYHEFNKILAFKPLISNYYSSALFASDLYNFRLFKILLQLTALPVEIIANIITYSQPNFPS